MNVLTIIPARSGSKRLPGKNWEKVGGKTLLQRALDCLPSNGVRGVGMDIAIVSDALRRCPKEERGHELIRLKEPNALASDATKMSDVVAWAYEAAKRETDCCYEGVLLLQPSSPLRNYDDVRRCLSAFMGQPHVDSIVSVTYDLATKDYKRNGAIYLTRWDLASRGELMGGTTQFYVMPPERSIDINTAEDLAEARRIAGD